MRLVGALGDRHRVYAGVPQPPGRLLEHLQRHQDGVVSVALRCGLLDDEVDNVI